MKVTLMVVEGPHQGKVFAFREHDNFIVGRGKHAHFRLPIEDKYFSRHHFLVRRSLRGQETEDKRQDHQAFVVPEGGHRVSGVPCVVGRGSGSCRVSRMGSRLGF